jgi:hypothetical protein
LENDRGVAELALALGAVGLPLSGKGVGLNAGGVLQVDLEAIDGRASPRAREPNSTTRLGLGWTPPNAVVTA